MKCFRCGSEDKLIHSGDDPPLCSICDDMDEFYYVFRWFLFMLALFSGLLLLVLYLETNHG